MKINLINDGVSRPVDALITSRIRDSLDSEFTLSFTLTEIDTPYIHDNTLVQYGEQYFNVISYQKDREGQSPTCAVECEHVSYSLNDDEYKLEKFVYSGSTAGALAAVLAGTPLTAGTVEPTGTVNISLTGGTRKAILISVAAIIGGEIEYSGYTVNLRRHRGSAEYIELLGTDNVTDVSYSRNVLNGTTTYNIQLGRKTILSCGDNVHIKFTPLEIDVQTRITAIEYNPYNTHEVEIEVGDYIPDILDNLQKTQTKAETALKTATDTANSLSGYAKKSEVSATVDTYINSETGRASIVASLSGTYITESDLSGYVEKTTLSAEIGAYIDTQAGTGKIVNNLSGTFITEDSLGNYVQKTDLNAGIESYIDTAAGTAKVVSAVSGTYVTQTNLNSTLGNYAKKGDIPDLTGYVQKTTLSAEIGAYIDTQAGTAKIVNNLSGTFITEDSLGNYVQKTDLNAGIESYIDTAAGTAKVVSAVSGTYVTQTNLNSTLGNYAQKSDIPALDGYLLESELNAGIETYIETASGKAQIVSAVSGTYVTQSNLNTTLNSYPTTTEMNSALSSYVKTTNLNSSIGTYIDSATGKAKVVSAASGTYQTISGMSDYAKTSALTTIEQSVSDVEASITLSSSYSKDTIGTNVYALLQLVSNANSSSIKIKADKIDFTGFTTFLRASDLSSSGSTTIDGGRITTGTISADRIDVSSLKVNTIYGKGSYSSYTAMTTDSTNLYVGGGSFTPSYTNVYLAAKTKVYFGSTGVFEICVDVANDSIYSTFVASLCGTSSYPWGEIHGGGSSSYHIVIADTVIRPSASSTYSSYSLGTSTYPWNAVYTKKLYLNGTEFSGGSNFAGSLVNMGGTTTYYIQATTSRQLCPNTSSTTYPFYLGTSGYYWHYAYIGSVAAYIGSSASSKLGFFGTTPVARKTVANTATVATLITALKAYGLIY